MINTVKNIVSYIIPIFYVHFSKIRNNNAHVINPQTYGIIFNIDFFFNVY